MATEEMQVRDQGARGDTTAVRPRATELVTDQGKTTIADVVVSRIAGIAAREVQGIHELVTQGMAGAVTGLAQRVTARRYTLARSKRRGRGTRGRDRPAADGGLRGQHPAGGGGGAPQHHEPPGGHDRPDRQRGQHRCH